MYYLILDVDSYNCYVIKCETLEELARRMSEFDNETTIAAGDLSKKEKHRLQSLLENLKENS